MFRTGIGYDIHRTAAGRRLVLAGVEVPHAVGLLGHSDADVVLHALCDALLGAAGLGDIGELFPDTDAQWKDADSRVFIAEVLRRIRAAGFAPLNVDVTILAERPKLAPYKPAMRAALAELMDLPGDAVFNDAATTEKLDALGREEAIACLATVLLQRINPQTARAVQ